jgi:hypothetical protein
MVQPGCSPAGGPPPALSQVFKPMWWW